MQRGEIWWANLRDPLGTEPGYRRPVVVVQADDFNRSDIDTVIVAAITSNLRLGAAPGNVPLQRGRSGLSRDSVVNVSQLLSIDRSVLDERLGRLPAADLDLVDEGLRRVLSL